MTQEEKELLLIDLCGRLPYGVMVGYSTKDNPNTLDKIGRVIYVDIRFGMIQMQSESGTSYGLPPSEFIKPYLRPMSSMTEEEKREIYNWLVENDVDWFDFSKLRLDEILISFDSSWLLVNWLLKNHFDYHGLIKKGLAIAVDEENNPYKE